MMKISIDFYRIRKGDGARAVIGRETAEAADRDDAIAVARKLSTALSMPQHPDAIIVTDSAGHELYCGMLEPQATSMNATRHDTSSEEHALAMGIWENEGGTMGPNADEAECWS